MVEVKNNNYIIKIPKPTVDKVLAGLGGLTLWLIKCIFWVAFWSIPIYIQGWAEFSDSIITNGKVGWFIAFIIGWTVIVNFLSRPKNE